MIQKEHLIEISLLLDLFQFHFLIKELSARENVALPSIKNGLPNSKAFSDAEKILKQLGLGEN